MTSEESLDRLSYFSKLWLSRITTSLAILLTIPTLAIMLTWNTLPGQKLYPIKRMLESVALKLVGNSFSVKADLQTQFVEQRFKEAETLLVQSSEVGLPDLIQQIQVTKMEIITASNKDGGKDRVIAQAKADKLVVQLKQYNQKLEEVKKDSSVKQVQATTQPINRKNAESTTQVDKTENANSKTITNTNTPAVPVESSTPPSGDSVKPISTVSSQVETTQAQITQVIIELEKVSNEAADEVHTDDNQGPGDGKGKGKGGPGGDNHDNSGNDK